MAEASLVAAAVATSKVIFSPDTKITPRLSSACCILLGGTPVLLAPMPAIAQLDKADTQDSEPWIMDIGLGNYVERDRNTGIELIVNGQRAIAEDYINIKAELDAITGATPNGATASNVPQTFTMSSGIGEYTTAANQLPADDTHMDVRMGLSLLYKDEINSDFSIDYKTHLSMEFDYLSTGIGISLKHDFNQHNTALIFGYDYEYNRVHPVGGTPIPLATMQPAGALQPRGTASASKRVNGFSLGITQVTTAQSFLQIKYSYSEASGYLTDPYKILSLIDNTNGETLGYIFENRPRQRKIQSLYISNKTYISGDVLDVSYRYYWDDWEMTSNTIDIRYRKKLTARNFFQPRFRYYTQTATNFFKHSLPDNQITPTYVSADFRMAEFDAYTVGVKYGSLTSANREHSISLDYYTQIGDSQPQDAIGLQKQQDLFPTLQTLVLFYNYAFKW